MSDPRPYGRSWSRGQSEAGLLGFVDSDDARRFYEGKDGPFRRVIAPQSWGTPARYRNRRAPEQQSQHSESHNG